MGVLEGEEALPSLADLTPVPEESSTAEVVGMDAADEGPDEVSSPVGVGFATQPVMTRAMTIGNSVTIHRGLMKVMIARIDLGGCRTGCR
ncbi:hypothetical protein ACOQFL_21585 [Actinopolyspora sp. H202]|uniref:hypothetical protein n=1 Tax=Actinopolyspora sp. H202 TaxID=1500456 RepID=UPI003EE623B2